MNATYNISTLKIKFQTLKANSIKVFNYNVKEVKEVDLYSAFVVVPHTQGAQVRITQCYLQITCLYLVYQMAPPQSEVADI